VAQHIEFGKPVNESERWAFDYFAAHLPADYIVLTNIDIPTRNGQIMEVDALVIGAWGIYVIDVKGYVGTLEVGHHVWLLDGRSSENYLSKASYIARVLAGRLKKKMPHGSHAPWCQGGVFVTGHEGDEIQLIKHPDYAVYSIDDVIEKLTTAEGINSQYQHQITDSQRRAVLEMIGQIDLVKQRNQQVQDFSKQTMLAKQQGFEVWVADYPQDNLELPWLLKIVVRSEFSCAEHRSHFEAMLKQEFNTLQQLAGTSGVPYCAPLLDDGEQLVLPIRMPRGKPLEGLILADAQHRMEVVRSAVSALQQIHQRGCTVGCWKPSDIFITEDGEIEFLSVLNNVTFAEDLVGFRHSFGELLTDVRKIGQWFGGESESLDELRLYLAAAITGRSLQGLDEELSIVEGALIDNRYLLVRRMMASETTEAWFAQHLLGRFNCGMTIYKNAEESFALLERQYRRLVGIYHPNLERVIDFDRLDDQGSFFITRVWIDAGTLAELDYTLNQVAILNCLKSLLAALGYAHAMGIYHGAICPDNIVLHEQPVLVNFTLGGDEFANHDSLKPFLPPRDCELSEAETDLFCLLKSMVPLLEQLDLPLAASTKINAILALDFSVEVGEDYVDYFGLTHATAEIKALPRAFAEQWCLTDLYRQGLVLDMLNTPGPHLPTERIEAAFRQRGIVPTEHQYETAEIALYELKQVGVLEELGNKIRLTTDFWRDWEQETLLQSA
jgi:hypothetical protein